MPDQSDELRALVDEALKQAMPVLRQRLGAALDPATVDLALVEGVIEAWTDEDDPLEIILVRDLYSALRYQQEGQYPGKPLGESAERRMVGEVYRHLMARTPLRKSDVHDLAYRLTLVEGGVWRALVLCGPPDDAVEEMLARVVARLTDRPMAIHARDELSGPDPGWRLDFNPGGVNRADLPRIKREGGQALVLRDLPREGRKVWVIDGVEAVAADVPDPAARAHARRGFWQMVSHWTDPMTTSALGYLFDRERGFFDEQEIALKGAAFVLRTSQTADDFLAELKGFGFLSLANAGIELHRAKHAG
jgi:hypothetical protein